MESKKIITRKLEESPAIADDSNYVIFRNRNKKAKVWWKFFRQND